MGIRWLCVSCPQIFIIIFIIYFNVIEDLEFQSILTLVSPQPTAVTALFSGTTAPWFGMNAACATPETRLTALLRKSTAMSLSRMGLL